MFASANFDCAIPNKSRVTACCFGALSIEQKNLGTGHITNVSVIAEMDDR